VRVCATVTCVSRAGNRHSLQRVSGYRSRRTSIFEKSPDLTGLSAVIAAPHSRQCCEKISILKSARIQTLADIESSHDGHTSDQTAARLRLSACAALITGYRDFSARTSLAATNPRFAQGSSSRWGPAPYAGFPIDVACAANGPAVVRGASSDDDFGNACGGRARPNKGTRQP
jgi:hypothetical protein